MNKWTIIFVSQILPVFAYALEEGAKEGGGLYALGAAIAISVAAMGGAMGQGKIGASAMEGLARNPQAQKNMFTSMILGLAFIESLVIYALVVSLIILGKF